MRPDYAIRILKETEETWQDKHDLWRIKQRTYDGLVKLACDCLIEFKEAESQGKGIIARYF
jgi:hypothetical protein